LLRDGRGRQGGKTGRSKQYHRVGVKADGVRKTSPNGRSFVLIKAPFLK
jgi:hypothetical protein